MTLALITGATSGIGRETARLFAKKGIDIIICGRRENRLIKLKDEVEKFCKVHYLVFDIGKKEEVENALKELPSEFKDVDILVNNAGNAHGKSSFELCDMDDWEEMIDTNIKGLLYVSRSLIPTFIEKKEGHIINIGSIAGKEVYPDGNVYCASKFAVDALTKSMRLDLTKHGIKVGAVNPGLVETEFSQVRYKGDSNKADAVYRGYEPLSPTDMAEIILFLVTRPRHVNIVDLTVFPSAQTSATSVEKDFPGN